MLQLTIKQPRKTRFTSITKQPRKARFTTNYKIVEAGLLQCWLIKGRRLVLMIDSQSRFSSHYARVLSVGGEEEKEASAPELVSIY